MINVRLPPDMSDASGLIHCAVPECTSIILLFLQLLLCAEICMHGNG